MYLENRSAVYRCKVKMVFLLVFMAGIFMANDCKAGQDGFMRMANPTEKANLIFTPKVESKDTAEKDCYVWFEANTERYMAIYLMNKEKWAFVGKPVVTARITNIESFADQLIDASVDAIVGFKTSGILNDNNYCDADSWQEIAKVAGNLSKKTKGKPVILENEGALKILISKGISTIDYDKLLKSISNQKWPEIWFWHGPMGEKEPLKTLSFSIAKAIKNGIPNCRLIEPNSAGISISSFNRNCQNNLRRTLDLDPNPISIIYLDDHKANYWELEDTDQAIRNAVSNTVIIYPGVDDIENCDAVLKSINK